MSKTFLFQAIQFSQSSNSNNSVLHKYAVSSIWPIDRTLSGATTPGQIGPGSNGNEGVLCIPQSSSITAASPSDCLVSYPGHLLGGDLTLLQRRSRCILQPQPNGQVALWFQYYRQRKSIKMVMKKWRNKMNKIFISVFFLFIHVCLLFHFYIIHNIFV